MQNELLYRGARNDFPLEKMTNVIGRAKSCDISVDDILISKKHFCIWYEDNEWRIKDLKSVNGTYLNGQIISEIYLLDDGDTIRAGGIEFVFKLNSEG
jgi:pSer/pThr/pTyr-binding forkhead associated (FHA) protein